MMNTTLRYIGISHKSASVSCRERFCLSDAEKGILLHRLQRQFEDIKGLFLLFTCNRAEVYFESKTTASEEVVFDSKYTSARLQVNKRKSPLISSNCR